MSSSSSSSNSLGYSTSSSSTSHPWNFVKPLLFGHSATDNGIIKNRLAQTIQILNSSISISKIYCYLYGAYQKTPVIPFNIYMGVYQCLDDGTPYNLIQEESISSANITGDGWFKFVFNTPVFSIPNGYISFVMRQDGGDENNYALWGYYNFIDSKSSKSFISNNGTSWTAISDTCFGLKVISGDQSLFDLDNGTVVSDPASEIQLHNNLRELQNDYDNGDGVTLIEYENTQFLENPDRISIKNPNLFVSFVLDKSGSMGWLDRFKKRVDFTTNFVSNLSNIYNGEIIYDVVGFGAVQLDPNSLTQSGTTSQINLDLRTPTRSTYIFEINNSTATAYANDIYSNNDGQFIVLNNSFSCTTISCISNSSPSVSGTLIKLSGSGDQLIPYSSYTNITIDNRQFVACGFKNFISGSYLESNYFSKTYNIGPIQVDGVTIVDPDSNNWRMFKPNWELYPIGEYPLMEVGNSGPSDNITSLDVSIPYIDADIYNPKIQSEIVIRNGLYGSKEANVANIISSISVGDSVINVYANANSFSTGEIIDIIDGKNFSYQHTISNVNGTSISFDPSSYYDINSSNVFGGIVERSMFYTPPVSITGTTVSLLVRDISMSSPYQITDFYTSYKEEYLTFFLQTTDGYLIEWDFAPFKEWTSMLLYWLGDSANFDFNLIDSSGDPLPDGTKITFFVNGYSDANASSATVESNVKSASNSSAIPTPPNSVPITQLASVGDIILYIETATGLAQGQEIIIGDNANAQQNAISIVGNTGNGKMYIQLASPLQYEFSPDRGANITLPVSKTIVNSMLIIDPTKVVSLPLPFIDVTPIYAGTALGPSYLLPSDPPQIDPLSTYEELVYNNASAQSSSTYNGPTNKGQLEIRILPITEDVLKSDQDKKKNSQLLLTLSTPDKIPDQLQSNSTDQVTVIPAPQINSTGIFIGDDFTIDSPIFLSGGEAHSEMVSYSTNFTYHTIDGLRMPIPDSELFSNSVSLSKSDKIYGSELSNNIYGKKYTISPAVQLTFTNNYNSFIQYTSPFDVYFMPPNYIYSNGDGQTIERMVQPYVQDYLYGSNTYNSGIFWGSEIRSPSIEKYAGMYSTSANTYSMNYTVTNRFSLLQSGNLIIRVYVNPMVNCEDYAPILASETLNYIPPAKSFILSENINIPNVSNPSALDTWRNTVAKNNLNNILAKLLTSLGDSYPVTQTPTAASGSSKILDIENWAQIGQETISIKNGKATYTIKSLDYPALVMIDAAYTFGNGKFEVVNKNFFFMANPLSFTYFDTYAFRPDTGQTFEIGGEVTWMNNAYGTIQDGTIVSIRATGSNIINTDMFGEQETVHNNVASSIQIVPSISETIDGEAGGIIIGPVQPWYLSAPNVPLLPGDASYISPEEVDKLVESRFLEKGAFSGSMFLQNKLDNA